MNTPQKLFTAYNYFFKIQYVKLLFLEVDTMKLLYSEKSNSFSLMFRFKFVLHDMMNYVYLIRFQTWTIPWVTIDFENFAETSAIRTKF